MLLNAVFCPLSEWRVIPGSSVLRPQILKRKRRIYPVIALIDVGPALFERARTLAAVLSETSGGMRLLVLGQAEADNWTGSVG